MEQLYFCELSVRLSQTVSMIGQNGISVAILVASKSLFLVVENCLLQVHPWAPLCRWQQLHQLPDSYESYLSGFYQDFKECK